MKIFCILSDKRASRSKSPAMFSSVMKRVGIEGTYVPFEVERSMIGKAVECLRILNIAGANVTIPYKEMVIPHLDQLSEGANMIGSINTIVHKGKILKGYNTNAIGFMDAFHHVGFDVTGKNILVFGTGGAAKAVVFILNWLRANSILIVGRSEEKAGTLVSRFGGQGKLLTSIGDQSFSVDLVVNATSVSSADESAELADLIGSLRIEGCEWVFDLNYGRRENFWQHLAKRQGIQFMDGLTALAYQARRTFALWTGIQVPPELFLQALNDG